MHIVHLHMGESQSVDVAEVVNVLVREFPGAEITAEDSFEAERQRAVENMAELARRGNPIKNPRLILKPIEDKQIRMGPGVDVAVPLGPGFVIKGYVWRRQIGFEYRQASIPPEYLAKLCQWLASLGVGQIRVV